MDQKRYLIWLKTEYKRAAAALPSILKRAVLLVAVCLAVAGMIALYTSGASSAESDAAKLRIGYAAGEDALTDFAVSYVQNMESVQSLCTLEPVDEAEGMRMLADGELAALIVLPENVVDEILSGSNAPAKLYLPERGAVDFGGGLSAVGSMLFGELARAAVGMLGTAQAEIYAASDIGKQFGAALHGESGGELLQAMYDDIDRFNLNVVAGREDLFAVKSLSATGNDTYAVYYGSAIFTVYVFLAGLFFGGFCKRGRLEQDMAEKRLGVGCAAQLACRCLAGIPLMLFVTLMSFLVFLFPAVRDLLSLEFSMEGILLLLLVMVFLTVYFLFFYQIVEKRQSALVAVGLSALLQAYLSGCLVPSVLLPEPVAAIGNLLPASFVKAVFTVLFTGRTNGASRIAAGLCLWTVILFVLAWAAMHTREADRGSAARRAAVGAVSSCRVPSVFMVMLRRLLHRKSIWVCMALVVVLSVAIVGTEKRSAAQINAAVYDADGAFLPFFAEYEGLVNFVYCDSEEEVKRAVQKGDAECGYILPDGLAEDITALRANGKVTVYRDEDAVAVPVVNEILFEKVFRSVSLTWFEGYIEKCAAQNIIMTEMSETGLRAYVDEAFLEQLEAGTTFTFETEYVDAMQGTAVAEGNESTYPVFLVMAAAMALCALQGILQVTADIRERRFYKRNRLAMSLVTIALPVLLGLVAGGLLLVGLKMF